MKTRITELLGIEHPIIQGGMHHVGLAELAAPSLMQAGLVLLPDSHRAHPKNSPLKLRAAAP